MTSTAQDLLAAVTADQTALDVAVAVACGSDNPEDIEAHREGFLEILRLLTSQEK